MTPSIRMTQLACLAALALPGASYAQDACPPGRNPPVMLPNAQKALATGAEIVIVALGSSSTQGWMASSKADSFPAQLQEDLEHAFPRAHFAVINRGIGGEDAAEEVLRLDADAIAVKPSIVIWQVGANGAMRNSDPAVFRKLVSAGIGRMQAAGIDVVLMDNQRAPMILASPEHIILDQTLQDLADQYHVSDFSRGALMDTWLKNGAPYDHFISGDSVHHNDLGYHCVARALSLSFIDGLTPPPPDQPNVTTVKR